MYIDTLLSENIIEPRDIMKKLNYNDVEAKEVGKGCKGVTIRWLVTKEMGAPHFAMRMFEVEPEGHTPLHTHEWEHEVFIVEGGGILVSESGEQEIESGDVIFMPGNEEHQFKNTKDKNMKFLCLIPHLD